MVQQLAGSITCDTQPRRHTLQAVETWPSISGQKQNTHRDSETHLHRETLT